MARRITAVQDRSIMDLPTLKGLLSITTTDYDALLTLALEAAKEQADLCMQNPFLELDPNIDFDALYQPLPSDLSFNEEATRSFLGGLRSFTSGGFVESTRIPGMPAYIFNSDPQNPDPADELKIPMLVELGLVEWVRGYMQLQCIPVGVTERKAGDVTEKYSDVSGLNDHVSNLFWGKYMLLPGM